MAPFLLSACSLGCNNGPTGPAPEVVVPAGGVINYQGKPLANYQVTLYPTDDRRAAVGMSDAEGKFKLGTNGKEDGAPPGEHKVVVNFVGQPPAQEPGKEEPFIPPPPPFTIPEKYQSREKTDAMVTIPEIGSQDLIIDLK